MSNILIALMMFSCSVKMVTTIFTVLLCPLLDGLHTDATVWNYGYNQQTGNSAQWNGINTSKRDVVVYIPVSKYPVKSHQPIAQKYVDPNASVNNHNLKPRTIIINRPPAQTQALSQPNVQLNAQQQLQLPYTGPNMPSKLPVQQTKKTFPRRPANSPFRLQNVDEYLLHAQMPLSIEQTYVMPNTAQTIEPEYLT